MIKQIFVRFLKYETNQRLKLKLSKSLDIKLETVLDWLNEKQEKQQNVQQQEVKLHLEQEVHKIVEKEVNKVNGQKLDSEHIAKELVSTLAPYLDNLVANTEERMEAVTDAYVTGNVQINNHKSR